MDTSFFTLFQTPRDSFTFSLSFEGNIPSHLHDAEMPLELTIHLLPEFTTLRPVIRPTSAHQELVLPNEETHVVPISFLPLSPTFNKASTVAWTSLAFRVQQWLIYYIQDQHLPHWKWGAEVFWTAFVAAFPSFPLGDWPRWDTRIPMAGAFIEKKVVSASFDEITQRASKCTAEDLIKRREELWEEFCELVKPMYPFPIHYDDALEDVN